MLARRVGRLFQQEGQLSHLTIERLPNGLLRVWDRACRWAAIYRPDGRFHSGAADCEAYRKAVAEFLGR